MLTAFALVSFAANSILCRMALGSGGIDPASFASLRLGTGAAVLALLAAARRGTLARRGFGAGSAEAPRAAARGRWARGLLLALYAIPFSFAYVTLGAGTGALLLFGAVQATMLAKAIATGERPHAAEWAGLAIAILGLVALVFPGLTAPSPLGAALMLTAGVAWGAYTIAGSAAGGAPLASTAASFARAVPAAALVSVALWPARLSARGAILAAASGAIASGLGYVAWYAALPDLTTTRAAVVQLSVPVVAALGGVLILGESITARLVISSIGVLGGVGLALRPARPGPSRGTMEPHREETGSCRPT